MWVVNKRMIPKTVTQANKKRVPFNKRGELKKKKWRGRSGVCLWKCQAWDAHWVSSKHRAVAGCTNMEGRKSPDWRFRFGSTKQSLRCVESQETGWAHLKNESRWTFGGSLRMCQCSKVRETRVQERSLRRKQGDSWVWHPEEATSRKSFKEKGLSKTAKCH